MYSTVNRILHFSYSIRINWNRISEAYRSTSLSQPVPTEAKLGISDAPPFIRSRENIHLSCNLVRVRRTEESGMCARSRAERNSCTNRWTARFSMSSFVPFRLPFLIKLFPFTLTFYKTNYIPLHPPVHPINLFHFSALLSILNLFPLFTWSTHYNFSSVSAHTLTTSASPGICVLFLALFLRFEVLIAVTVKSAVLWCPV
jgi:hypothetical protein